MKIALTILVVMMAASSFGQNIYVAKSQDRTSEDLPLSYVEQKTTFDGSAVDMVGTVKNTGSVPYEWVKVVFTASKSSGAFIDRNYSYSDPKEIGPGQIAFVECRINTNGEKPGKIEWTLMGRRPQ